MRKLTDLVPWYVWVLISLATVSLGAFGLYKWGYNKAEDKYVLLLEEQKRKVTELEGREEVVRIETVVEYRDRVKTVIKYRDRIIQGAKDELGDEVNQCIIGPNFVRLHNASARSESLPAAGQRPNGATKGSSTDAP